MTNIEVALLAEERTVSMIVEQSAAGVHGCGLLFAGSCFGRMLQVSPGLERGRLRAW